MSDLKMPAERKMGWNLKPKSSSHFNIHSRENGQFCVVLNHAVLRGVRAEMIHWWFLNFANLKVRLTNVQDYENELVPAYWLWHPIDHLSATLTGNLGPGDTATTGCKIQIREAMQYDTYGWKYPVDTELKVFYVGDDGWAMGKALPVFGPVMMLRIHFKDVFEDSVHVGVHYHYEVVIGVSGNGFFSRLINKKIAGHFGTEFFSAWQRHNVIEVGTFENFLPALFNQRHDLSQLAYSPDMDPVKDHEETQAGYSQELFDKRLEGFLEAIDPYKYQQYDKTSFL